MEKKIKISFVYRDCLALTEKSFYTHFHNFYFKALKRNNDIEVNYVLSDKQFNAESLEEKQT